MILEKILNKSKMKLIIIIFAALLLTSQKSNAQKNVDSFSIKCTYDLQFQPDSTDLNSKRSDRMLLFLNGNNSLFISEKKFLLDSADVADAGKINSGSMITVKGGRTDFRYTITKNSSNQINTVDYTARERFQYSEPRNIFHWKLLADTATIAGFHCQKAETNFSGRKWIAWFTTEIPINDGPYKFEGLPGLIIKINDSQNYYVFTLSGLENKNFTVTSPKLQSPIKTSKEKFFALSKKYNQNKFEMDQQHGITFTSGQEEIKKRLQELAKKNNNPIELIN